MEKGVVRFLARQKAGHRIEKSHSTRCFRRLPCLRGWQLTVPPPENIGGLMGLGDLRLTSWPTKSTPVTGKYAKGRWVHLIPGTSIHGG